MEKFYYEEPTIERKEDAIDFIKEFRRFNSHINGSGGLNRMSDNYEGWLLKLDEDEKRSPSEEGVPTRTFFFVRESDKRIIGMINIRLVLNAKLRVHGGNIGYSIRPTERNKGYNKINLYLGLKKCSEFGLEEVLLDADLSNVASWKTMEALGGKIIGQHEEVTNEGIQTVVDYNINVQEALNNHREYEEKISSEKHKEK